MRISSRLRTRNAAVVGALAVVALVPGLAWGQSLASQRALVTARYPDVQWVTTRALAARLAGPPQSRPVLLDARTAREVRVSHLAGARRVDPDHPDIASLGLAHDDAIVVYCSVGWRSGKVADELQRAGFTRVENLEGGIFAWVNEGRPVYRGHERVSVVDPYDAVWGLMVDPAHRARVER